MHLGDRDRQVSINSKTDDILISNIIPEQPMLYREILFQKNQQTNRPPPPNRKEKKSHMKTQNVKKI